MTHWLELLSQSQPSPITTETPKASSENSENNCPHAAQLTCFSAVDSSTRNRFWAPLDSPLRPRSRELFPIRTALLQRSTLGAVKAPLEKKKQQRSTVGACVCVSVFVPPYLLSADHCHREPPASRDPELCSPLRPGSTGTPTGCRRPEDYIDQHAPRLSVSARAPIGCE